MKVLHSEGLANRADPESCGGGREAAAEALTGEATGRVLSRENDFFRVPTRWDTSEGHACCRVNASDSEALRGRSARACREAPRDGNREILELSGTDGGPERTREASRERDLR